MKRNIHIFADRTNMAAMRYSAALKKALTKANYEIVSNPRKDTQLIVVLGGDHTMQRAKERHVTLGVPFLGLNLGHKGFMMNDSLIAEEAARNIKGNNYRIKEFPLLAISRLQGRDYLAMGDFYINRMGPQACKMNVVVDAARVAQRIVADGIIVSTALGSTGYNLAAGGSAIEPSLDVMCVTPICVHSPIQMKPMIFRLSGCSVIIEVLNTRKGDVRAFYDGFRFPYPPREIHIFDSGAKIQLAFWIHEDLTRHVIEKVMRIQE